MTFGSLFTGVGGFDLGFDHFMECKWQVESDAKALSVLRLRWPDVPKFQDVRCFAKGRKTKDLKVDVICGVFPCQDLSVAGKGAGILGERSGLFFEMLRVVDRLRPRFLVWENVPGLLASDDRRDFAIVLRSLADCGYFGATRIVDARYFGVPQRRRRVFGVFADVRSGTDFRSCCEILALSDGLQRHLAPRRAKGQDIAATLRSRTHGRGVSPPGRGGEDDSNLVAGTLGGGSGSRGWPDDTDRMTFIPELARCVTTGEGNRQDQETCTLIASSITASQGHHGHSSPRGDGSDNLVVAHQCHGGSVGEMGTLRRGNGNVTGGVPFLVASFDERQVTSKTNRSRCESDVMGTQHTSPHSIAIMVGVRRLTPRECERCQGFPDDWTRWDDEGKDIADSQRYRMIGNAVVPVVARWIGRRLVEVAS